MSYVHDPPSATRGWPHAHNERCSCLVGVCILQQRSDAVLGIDEYFAVSNHHTTHLLCKGEDLATSLTFYYDKVDMRVTMGESL